jgi:hypothetical protein
LNAAKAYSPGIKENHALVPLKEKAIEVKFYSDDRYRLGCSAREWLYSRWLRLWHIS